jgi:hypothetical protein
MRKNSTEFSYPFQWLDELIFSTLNPDKVKIEEHDIGQFQKIEAQFAAELAMVFTGLKTTTFCLFSDKKLSIIVGKYQEGLQFLIEQSKHNLAKYPDGHPLSVTGESLIIQMEHIQSEIERRYGKYLTDRTPVKEKHVGPGKAAFKILCPLSVDQMGLILKAADDIKLVMSRSISLVFRSIVPYLSTREKEHVSWNSMRSSTYHPEEKDKNMAIAALEKLIKKIREY